MASPAEIANDLEAQSRRLINTHMRTEALSYKRGADTIRHLMSVIHELEAAAEVEALAFEAYRNGEDR
tara:strand:- start:470 stop:673 length:204 start_codon:yes stop_codon:yes gene_type:complete